MKFIRITEVEAFFVNENGDNFDELAQWALKNGFHVPRDRDDIPTGKWIVSVGNGLLEIWDDNDFQRQHKALERTITCKKHLVTVHTKERKIEHLGCKRETLWVRW